MLDEIIKRYSEFFDSVISQVIYKNTEEMVLIEIIISCKNFLNECEYEKVRIEFIDVISFRFLEGPKVQSHAVMNAFIKKENGVIIFDFFPFNMVGNTLKINEESSFIILCKNIKYEVLT